MLLFLFLFFSVWHIVKKKVREELTRALLEAAATSNGDDGGSQIEIQKLEASNGGGPISFKDLVRDFTSNKQDIRYFAITTKTMVGFCNLSLSLIISSHPPIVLYCAYPYLFFRLFIWTHYIYNYNIFNLFKRLNEKQSLMSTSISYKRKWN